MLVSAWEDNSLQVVADKDPSVVKYWKRIVERFEHDLGWRTNCSLNSITNQWGAVEKICSCWVGCLEQVKHVPPNGVTIDHVSNLNIFSLPHFHYFEHSYHFDHCFVLGKHSPRAVLPMPKSKGKPFGHTTKKDTSVTFWAKQFFSVMLMTLL